MTDFLRNLILFIITLLPAIPFLILCLINRGINLKKENRCKQFFMPVLALAYVIIAVLLARQINTMILDFLAHLPIWLALLAHLQFIPSVISAVLMWIANALNSFYELLNVGYGIFYVSNIILFLLYFIYKKICIRVLEKLYNRQQQICKDPEKVRMLYLISEKLIPETYTYDQDDGAWCIRSDMKGARSLSKVVYYITVISGMILMGIMAWIYARTKLADIFYPVLAVILVGEIFFFLDGLTRAELKKSIQGEKDTSNKIVNYSLLRNCLQDLFGDRLLSERVRVNVPFVNRISNREILDNLNQYTEPKDVAFATFFRKLNEKGFGIDNNYLNSSLDLLHGKSILFNNPFYYDLIPYAFYPMNRMLLSHRKVLVVLGRHSIETDVEQWILDGIESVTNIPFMWKVSVLGKNSDNPDI